MELIKVPKIHKQGLDCGIAIGYHKKILRTQKDNEVTCKKCRRLINDEKAQKLYEVTYYCFDGSDGYQIIKAPTASKAIYKCFKLFVYDGECHSESIGVQFQRFRNRKPKAKLVKDKNIKPTMTWQEEKEFKKKEIIKKAEEFDSKYPVGTKVLFQADFTEKVIVTTTRSKAQVNNDYLTIFLDGVSGSYVLDYRFVRVLTDENKNLKTLR